MASEFKLDEDFDVETKYNISLSNSIPTIIQDWDSNIIVNKKRGLIPSWSKNPLSSHNLWNARSETIFDKPSFSHAIRTNRCIVPASWFYERETKLWKKYPSYISPNKSSYFWFAGICDTWQSTSWEFVSTTSIITISPNDKISLLHDRMPLILDPSDYEWRLRFDEDKEYIRQFFKIYHSDNVNVWSVNPAMNSVKYQESDCIIPRNGISQKWWLF